MKGILDKLDLVLACILLGGLANAQALYRDPAGAFTGR